MFSKSIGLSAVLLCLLVSSTNAQQLVFPDEEWETAAPESVWVDGERLNAAVGTLANPNETMVIQNGRAIWQGENIDSPQHVYSVTKTYTSVVLGALIDDGKITVDSKLSEFVPAMVAENPDATFGHFVTQTSGYAAEGEVFPLSLDIPDDVYAPTAPLFTPPGSQFVYTGAAMDMLAYGLSIVAEEPIQSLFQRRFADPMQMDANWDWLGFRTEDDVEVDGGSGYPDLGVSISASNAARLGLLYLARGNWDGEQLISSDWVDESRKVQVPSTTPHHSLSAVGGGPGVYGFGWWVSNDGWYEAIGFSNNYISVNPSSNTVIVSLGTESGGNSNIDAFKQQVRRAILPAVWDGPDGDWDELNQNGKFRWSTESGELAEVYPTNSVVIPSGVVSVRHGLSVGSVELESSTLHIHDSADFEVSGSVELKDGSLMKVEGPSKIGRLELNEGSEAAILAPFNVEQVVIAGGQLALHGDAGPIEIDGRFRTDDESELRFVLNGNEWESKIHLTAARAKPRFDGELVFEIDPRFDPSSLVGKTFDLFDWVERAQPSTEFDSISADVRLSLNLDRFYTDGEIKIEGVLEEPVSAGDFNGDGTLDLGDISLLSASIAVDSTDSYFDLDGNSLVTSTDLNVLVVDLVGTSIGDANLDGNTDFIDFLALANHFGGPGSWAEGDFDGDGHIRFLDFLALANNFSANEAAAAVAVPEPSFRLASVSSILMMLCMVRRRRRNSAF